MIVAVGCWGVFPADVDNGVAGRQEGRVSGADERSGLIGGEKSKKVDSKGFVGVKSTTKNGKSGLLGMLVEWIDLMGIGGDFYL